MTNISYKTWIAKPRCTLISETCSAEKFAEVFANQAKALLQHSFIAKQQSSFHRFRRENLANDECMAICDFAENYAFVIQDAAPGFHWNNNQATVYPVVLYYKCNGILNHKSLVIISDCLQHDAVTVWALSEYINDLAKSLVPDLSKIIYFSDGAPQQFKNYKNFVNIYFHQFDFHVSAEWHFFPTAHGKGPCDGIGGTVKRLATRASLQRLINHPILEPIDLFNWANTPGRLPSITVKYWEKEKYDLAANYLKDRFENTCKIPQTQRVHCVIPIADEKLITKNYSFAEDYSEHRLMKK